MLYLLSKEFTKISETSGSVQNASRIRTLEMSETTEPSKGIIISTLRTHTFTGTTIYLRCVDGYAQIRVVPFILDGGGHFDNSSTSDDDFLNAAWNGDYTPDPLTDAVIDDMWNSNDLIDTGDGFDDVINSFLSP